MAFENLEAIPRGAESPNVYGPADAPLTVQTSQMMGSVRKGDLALLKPIEHTKQPQGAKGVDWSNSITKGLVGLIDGSVAGGARDLVTGERLAFKTIPLVSNNGYSYGNLSGTTTGGVASNRISVAPNEVPNWRPTSPIMTLAVAFNINTFVNSGILAANTGGPDGFNISDKFTDGSFVAQLQSGGLNATVYGNSGSTKLGVLSVIVMTYDGIALKAYCNGKYVGQHVITMGNLTNYGSTFNKIQLIGGGADGGGAIATGHWMALWNRPLSAAEVKDLCNNPWSLFAPIRRIANNIAIPQKLILPSKTGVTGPVRTLKEVCSSQANAGPSIDWSNPITQKLLFAGIPQGNTFIDAVTGKLATPPSNASYLPRNNNTLHLTGNEYTWPTGATKIDALTTKYSVFFEGSQTGGTFGTLIGSISPANGSGFKVLPDNGSNLVNGLTCLNFVGGYGATYGNAFGTTLGNNKPYRAMFTFDGATGYLYSKNRVIQTGAYTYLPESNATRYTFMCSSNGFFSTNVALVFGRVLSLEEYKSLEANPWQVFKKQAAIQFVGKNTLPNTQVYRNKLPWTQQPQSFPLVNSELTNAVLPDGILLKSLVGTNWTQNFPAGLSRSVTKVGRSVLNSSSGFFSRNLYPQAGPITVCIVHVPINSSEQSGIWSIGSSETDGTPNILIQKNLTDLQVYCNGGYQLVFPGVVKSGYPLNIVLTLDNIATTGSILRLSVNGVSKEYAGGVRATGETIEYLGAGYPSVQTGHLCLYWSKPTLSSIYDMTSFSLNPWSIFQPLNTRIPNITPVKAQPPINVDKVCNTIPSGTVQLNRSGIGSKIRYIAVASGPGYMQTCGTGNNTGMGYGAVALASSRTNKEGTFRTYGSGGYGEDCNRNGSRVYPNQARDVTTIAVFEINNLSISGTLVIAASSGSAFPIHGTATLNIDGSITFTFNGNVTLSSAPLSNGVHTIVLVNSRSTARQFVYIDGIKLGTEGTSVSQGGFSLDFVSGGHGSGSKTGFYLGLMASSPLSFTEHEAISICNNPWQIFEKPKYPIRLK